MYQEVNGCADRLADTGKSFMTLIPFYFITTYFWDQMGLPTCVREGESLILYLITDSLDI